jgi:ketosteroid isomerase-like protein
MFGTPEWWRSSLRTAVTARFHGRRGAARHIVVVGLTLGLSLALFHGCAPRPAADALAASRRAELEAADRAWSAAAARESAVGGISAMLAEDVRFLQDGEPIVRGREAAVAAMLRGDDGGLVQTWTPSRVGVSRDGAFGWSYGFLERRARDAVPGDAGRPGKYIAVWRREADGAWRAVAYVRTDRAPGEISPALPAGFAGLARRADDAAAAGAAGAADARQAALDADRAFSADAAASGVGEAFARFAAADGALLGSGPSLVLGPDAIRAAFAGRPAGATLVWRPVDAVASDAGDLAFTVGEAESRNPATGAVGHSKYLTVWRLQPDGEWRYVVDGGNARPAVATGPRTGD